MKRVRFPADLTYTKAALIVMTGFIALIVSSAPMPDLSQRLFLFLGMAVVFGSFWLIFHKAKTLEFDAKNLYVVGNQAEETVPLRSINTIKITMTGSGNQKLWKIKYVDNTGLERAVRVLPNQIT